MDDPYNNFNWFSPKYAMIVYRIVKAPLIQYIELDADADGLLSKLEFSNFSKDDLKLGDSFVKPFIDRVFYCSNNYEGKIVTLIIKSGL